MQIVNPEERKQFSCHKFRITPSAVRPMHAAVVLDWLHPPWEARCNQSVYTTASYTWLYSTPLLARS